MHVDDYFEYDPDFSAEELADYEFEFTSRDFTNLGTDDGLALHMIERFGFARDGDEGNSYLAFQCEERRDKGSDSFLIVFPLVWSMN